MFEPIVIRARKQPYVGFGIILGSIIALSIYVAVHIGKTSALEGGGAMSFLLLLIYYYLSTLRLELSDSTITYKELWRTKEIPILAVGSLERGQNLFGAHGSWIIHLRDNTGPIMINVANFRSSDLNRFTATLLKENPTIKASV